MAAAKKKASGQGSRQKLTTFERTLENLRRSCDLSQLGLQRGNIRFRLTDKEGDCFCLECTEISARVTKGEGAGAPLVEVIGSAKDLEPVLAGKKDAAAAFVSGGIRVRGNVRYLEEVAKRLGLLNCP